MLMTQATFAKKMERSRQYINKLVHKGIIPVYDKKQVKYEEAKQILEDIKDPRRDPQREANAKKRESDLFSVAGTYQSVADMSEKEKEKELQEKRERLLELQSQAQSLGVDVSDELTKELDSLDIKELNKAILFQDLRIKRVKADEGENQVISIEKVSQDIFSAARVIRDGFQGIPSRLAARLAAENNPHECRVMLELEINQQLNNLSEVFRESQSSL